MMFSQPIAKDRSASHGSCAKGQEQIPAPGKRGLGNCFCLTNDGLRFQAADVPRGISAGGPAIGDHRYSIQFQSTPQRSFFIVETHESECFALINLLTAFEQVALGPPADLVAFIRQRLSTVAMPSPWEAWTLVSLVRPRLPVLGQGDYLRPPARSCLGL